MDWLTNEFLFYGGIVFAAFSLAVLLIELCISKIKMVRLNVQMDKEYGEQPKMKKH